MKRILIFVFAFLLGGIIAFRTPKIVYAEEVGTEQQEVIETENEETFEEFKQKVEEKLSQFFDTEKVAQIVEWLVHSGVLAALFTITLKYKKYKNTTVDDLYKKLKTELKDYLQEYFNKMSDVEVKKLTDSISDLENSIETVMKVLVLMQDNTAKGKATLLEYLGTKTENKEVKQLTQEVNDTIAEQEQVKKEIKEKVKDDYQNIF